MPKAKSAEKQARSSQRKRLQNHSVKSTIRNGLSRLAVLLTSDPKAARTHGYHIVSLLDRAAKTRVLHVNATRRYKARVMSRLNALPKS